LFGFILAFLAAIISNYNQIGYHSGTNPANACINNLRQIDAAKNEWALENGKSNGVIVTENNIKSYIKLDSSGNIPKCPAGGTYTIGKVGKKPTCSVGGPIHTLP